MGTGVRHAQLSLMSKSPRCVVNAIASKRLRTPHNRPVCTAQRFALGGHLRHQGRCIPRPCQSQVQERVGLSYEKEFVLASRRPRARLSVPHRSVLTRYFPKPKVRKEKLLLSSTEDALEEVEEIVSDYTHAVSEQLSSRCEGGDNYCFILAPGGSEPLSARVLVTYSRQNLTLALVSDNPQIPYAQIPPPVSQCA